MRIAITLSLALLCASAARADDVLDGFEGFGDAAPWRCSDWAAAFQNPPVQGPAGATEGAFALQVPVRLAGEGYAQGHVGRPTRLDLRDAGSLALDVTLPPDAPPGLRAKVILLVGPQARGESGAGQGPRWVEPTDGTPLPPGASTVVRVRLAGDVEDPPDRALLGEVVGYGLKVEAQHVTWSGTLALDRVRLEGLRGDALGPGPVRPVGVFGGFGSEVPRRNGYLTFVADADLGAHALRWPKLGPGGKDLRVGEARFGGVPLGAVTQRFLDWTALELRGRRLGFAGTFEVRALLSRAFPAVRYRTTGRSFEWASGLDGRPRASRLAVVLDGRPTVHDLARGALDLSRMSEPWLLLWSGSGGDVPVLLTLERRPRRADPTSSGVQLEFGQPAGCVQVLPLSGLRRRADTGAWVAGLPPAVLHACRAWVQPLAAFPVACRETADVAGDRVRVACAWRHEAIADAWGTVPTPIAPVPPTVVLAATNGYPADLQGATVTGVATFFGPFAHQPGATSRFTLPAPAGARRLPVALRVESDPAVAPARAELERWVREDTPRRPIPDFIDNNDRAAAFLAGAYPTLPDPERAVARAAAPRLVERSWRADALLRLVEPVTGQAYLAPGRVWCSKEPFDKEWYTGRQLASLALVSETFDPGLARAVWPQALGLYRYFRLFNDWATGSTLSSVYGITALCDGLHFAWEGMLGVARLAELLGDRATHRDAVHRAARQQAALFALWHQAAWARDLDYAVGHLTHARVAPADVETVGGVDGFVEETGCTTLEMRSFWQTANYLFFDNVPQLSFYRDHGLSPRVARILDEVVPAKHPRWRDGDVLEPVDGKYYGSEYAAAQLMARALLLHQDPRPLLDVYERARGTAQSRQWYTMHRFGIAGPTLLALERARAPVVEVPAWLRLERATWDAARGEVELEVVARRDGDAPVRVTPVGGAPREVRVALRRGATRTLRFPGW